MSFLLALGRVEPHLRPQRLGWAVATGHAAGNHELSPQPNVIANRPVEFRAAGKAEATVNGLPANPNALSVERGCKALDGAQPIEGRSGRLGVVLLRQIASSPSAKPSTIARVRISQRLAPKHRPQPLSCGPHSQRPWARLPGD